MSPTPEVVAKCEAQGAQKHVGSLDWEGLNISEELLGVVSKAVRSATGQGNSGAGGFGSFGHVGRQFETLQGQ